MYSIKKQEWQKEVTELEQMETLTEDKERLLFENAELEKQQKKLQQEINWMMQSKKVMEQKHGHYSMGHFSCKLQCYISLENIYVKKQ